jgi:hypothetical protein
MNYLNKKIVRAVFIDYLRVWSFDAQKIRIREITNILTTVEGIYFRCPVFYVAFILLSIIEKKRAVYGFLIYCFIIDVKHLWSWKFIMVIPIYVQEISFDQVMLLQSRSVEHLLIFYSYKFHIYDKEFIKFYFKIIRRIIKVLYFRTVVIVIE